MSNPRNRTGRINKPPRRKFTYFFPATASRQHGFLSRTLPQGVQAEITVCPYLIITPLVRLNVEKATAKPHSKRMVLTHKQSGARLAGPCRRFDLLHIAGALSGLGLDWSQGKDAIERQGNRLPPELHTWVRLIRKIGEKEFDKA